MSRSLKGFCWSFQLFVSFLACQTLAEAESSDNNSPAPTGTKHCNNIYFYEAPKNRIENMLQKMNERLIEIQDEIKTLKGNSSK